MRNVMCYLILLNSLIFPECKPAQAGKLFFITTKQVE